MEQMEQGKLETILTENGLTLYWQFNSPMGSEIREVFRYNIVIEDKNKSRVFEGPYFMGRGHLSEKQKKQLKTYRVSMSDCLNNNGVPHGFIVKPKVEDILYCIFSDGLFAKDYPEEIDFIRNSGYGENLESFYKGVEAYKHCRATWSFMQRCFPSHVIEEIQSICSEM